jgi:hypothetical protein
MQRAIFMPRSPPDLLQVLVRQAQAVGQVVAHRVAAAEVRAVDDAVGADDFDHRLAHRQLVQFDVEREVLHVVEHRLFVVLDVQVRIGLRQAPELVRHESTAVGNVDLEVREAVEHPAIDQVPEALGLVVVHADDGRGLVAVGVGLFAPGHRLVIAVHEHRQVDVAQGFPHRVHLRRVELEAAEVGAARHQALGAEGGAGAPDFLGRL